MNKLLAINHKIESISTRNYRRVEMTEPISPKISPKLKLKPLNRSELGIFGEKTGVRLPHIRRYFGKNETRLKIKRGVDMSTDINYEKEVDTD